MIQKYVLRVDTLCRNCHYRNQIYEVFDKPTDIIACGKCGTMLVVPDDLAHEEKEIIREMIDTALSEEG